MKWKRGTGEIAEIHDEGSVNRAPPLRKLTIKLLMGSMAPIAAKVRQTQETHERNAGGTLGNSRPQEPVDYRRGRGRVDHPHDRTHIRQEARARAAAPQVVKVAKAVQGDMPETLSELGTVTPIATVTVLPQLSGYLTAVGLQGRPGRQEGPVPRADRSAPV